MAKKNEIKTQPTNRYYPAKRGNVFRGNREGAWKKRVLKLTRPLDNEIERVVLELHNSGFTIEEISYVLHTSVYHIIGKYSMLGKVVQIKKK